MMKRLIVLLTMVITQLLGLQISRAEVVVIYHDDFNQLSSTTIQRIYTGRIIEIDGLTVTPVNAKPSAPSRAQFLQRFLEQDEEKYTAYWTVRRFIGKGTPPEELNTEAEIIEFVQNNSGAIGYVDSRNIEIPSAISILNK